MKILHLISAMFVVISVAVGASGQGCGGGRWMSPGYVLWSGGTADATHIYSSVIADGSTGGTCPEYCNCNGVTHTIKAYNQLSSTGGWQQQQPKPWNTYLFQENDQQITATPGVVYAWTIGGLVDCSFLGLFWGDGNPKPNGVAVETPACGLLNLFGGSPSTVACDGKTTYVAGMSVAGSGVKAVTEVATKTTTDNTLVIDLIGGATGNPLCTNKVGSYQWCYQQSYKAFYYAQNPKGNIKWNTQVWCGTKQNPDVNTTILSNISCR